MIYCKRVLFVLAILVSIIVSGGVNAAWLNSTGKVTSINTYAGRETVLIVITTDGADVAECSSKTTFAISSSISSEARARMYSMLLSAQATGRSVTLSYNDVGSCEPWDSASNVYRKIVRLQ